MLPRARVLKPSRLGAALEVVLVHARLGEQGEHGGELVRAVNVRRARDRDLAVVQVGTGADEGERLDRFCRAPEVGDEVGIARRLHDRPVGDRDGVNDVPGLDDACAGGLHHDRIHLRNLPVLANGRYFPYVSTIVDHWDPTDYPAEDTLLIQDAEQLRALGGELRGRIISLLRERAWSTQQLARELDLPKGTVGHHLKVLERAGLIRVVHTRKVRAVTEMFYGRVARLFLFHIEDPEQARAAGASTLRDAAFQLERAVPEESMWGLVLSRLTKKDADRFARRANRLLDDFRAADSAEGRPYRLALAYWAVERPDEERDA